VDAIEDAIAGHNSDLTTKVMAFVALLKLSSGFPSISEYVHLISALIDFQLFTRCICALSI